MAFTSTTEQTKLHVSYALPHCWNMHQKRQSLIQAEVHTTCKSDLSFTNILHTIYTSNLTIQRRHNPIMNSSYASYLSGDMNVMGVCWISALSRLKTGASLGEGFSILFVQVFISLRGETQVLWLVVASIDPLERLNMSSRSMRK